MSDDIAVIPVEIWLISSSLRKTVNKILALESDSYYCKYFSASTVEVSWWCTREYFLKCFWQES